MNLLAALALLLPLSAQVKVDQKSVDDAIARGIAFLKTAESPSHLLIAHGDELILYTFVVAGVPESDERFQKLLARVLSDEPTHTYRVALQAMLLEELDRVKYQERIALCAQFLVDNQCANGQWSYGEPTKLAKDDGVASGGGRKAEPIASAGVKAKPAVLRRIPIRAQRTGPAEGDNSNTQYGALGLRACHDAGILLPESVLTRGERWWRSTMTGDRKPEKNAVASGGEASQGWGYKRGEDPYNTMTAGGAGCLVIYSYLLKRDWKKDAKTQSAIRWLAGNYWLSGPPAGVTPFWYYYYLYAIERVGMLYDTALIGNKDWYFDGAKWLLEQQTANGAWDQNKLYSNPSNPTYDTCFAILFLKKATRGLTVSKDR